MNDIAQDQTYRPADRVMQGVIPYISLPGQCAAAADFYIKAFAARDIGRLPMEGKPGQYMHLQLEINGGALMMSDGGEPVAENAPSALRGHLQLVVPDGQAWWDRAVAAGCAVATPFERQFWGDDWGMLRDPFGLLWAVLTPNPALVDKAG